MKFKIIGLLVLSFLFCRQLPAQSDSVGIIKVRKKVKEDSIFSYPEVMPEFPGGYESLMTYLGRTIVYPDSIKDKRISGKVFCQFIVEKNGDISNVKILRSPHPAFSESVIQSVKKMPPWTPGEQKGEPVKIKMIIPIYITLK